MKINPNQFYPSSQKAITFKKYFNAGIASIDYDSIPVKRGSIICIRGNVDGSEPYPYYAIDTSGLAKYSDMKIVGTGLIRPLNYAINYRIMLTNTVYSYQYYTQAIFSYIFLTTGFMVLNASFADLTNPVSILLFNGNY